MQCWTLGGIVHNASVQIFTSTNESNRHMQHVLAKAGYHLAGRIEELDPGDPEIIYVKTLEGQP